MPHSLLETAEKAGKLLGDMLTGYARLDAVGAARLHQVIAFTLDAVPVLEASREPALNPDQRQGMREQAATARRNLEAGTGNGFVYFTPEIVEMLMDDLDAAARDAAATRALLARHREPGR